MKGNCWQCAHCGKTGWDPTIEKPTAWCLAKSLIVAPERGCNYFEPKDEAYYRSQVKGKGKEKRKQGH